MTRLHHHHRCRHPLSASAETHIKTVRIALPPSPPPEMEPDSKPQARRSERIHHSLPDRIVLPTDAVEEPERLRSGSRWRQHDLALLKVKFDPDVDSRLSVLDAQEPWTAEQWRSTSPPPPPLPLPLPLPAPPPPPPFLPFLQTCMQFTDSVIAVDSLAAELSSITPEALATSDDHITQDAPRFCIFFKRLKLLLSENKDVRAEFVSSTEQSTVQGSNSPSPSRPRQLSLETPDSPPLSHPLEVSVPHLSDFSSSPTSKKRPNSLTLTSPLKVRNTTAEHNNAPRTPDQPTIPHDPDYSGDSNESTDEDNTKQMITTLVLSTLAFLGHGFNKLLWPLYTGKCSLEMAGSSNFF
jgi:hypothetical protein